jgi:hypothetical protein
MRARSECAAGSKKDQATTRQHADFLIENGYNCTCRTDFDWSADNALILREPGLTKLK